MRTNLRGFTLVELVIGVAIVGILTSIAVPSYRESVRNGKRADAKAALTSFANAMEIHKMQNVLYSNSYENAGTVGGTPANTGAPKATVFPNRVPISGGTKTYDLAIEASTASTYTITAAPVDGGDTCGTFKLTNTGVKTVTGSRTDCW